MISVSCNSILALVDRQVNSVKAFIASVRFGQGLRRDAVYKFYVLHESNMGFGHMAEQLALILGTTAGNSSLPYI